MKIADRALLVTGANRGLGRVLVEEALRRGAKRVFSSDNIAAVLDALGKQVYGLRE